jgi:hypothetical protein
MAKTPLGDIPGARFHEPNIVQNASVASNGANARLGMFGPFAHDIRVRNAWWTPTGADAAGTQTATYRRLSMYNGGSSGTLTATGSGTATGLQGRIASLNLNPTVSFASLGPVAMTVIDATGTSLLVASGNIIYFSQETVGGTDANGTVLPAGQFSVAFEVV